MKPFFPSSMLTNMVVARWRWGSGLSKPPAIRPKLLSRRAWLYAIDRPKVGVASHEVIPLRIQVNHGVAVSRAPPPTTSASGTHAYPPGGPAAPSASRFKALRTSMLSSPRVRLHAAQHAQDPGPSSAGPYATTNSSQGITSTSKAVGCVASASAFGRTARR